ADLGPAGRGRAGGHGGRSPQGLHPARCVSPPSRRLRTGRDHAALTPCDPRPPPQRLSGRSPAREADRRRSRLPRRRRGAPEGTAPRPRRGRFSRDAVAGVVQPEILVPGSAPGGPHRAGEDEGRGPGQPGRLTAWDGQPRGPLQSFAQEFPIFDWIDRANLPIFPLIGTDLGIPVVGRIPAGMLMGQGRRIQSVYRRILLIAVAIQGITPGAADLASARSLVLLCPALPHDEACRGGALWPDEACTVSPIRVNGPKRQWAKDPPPADFLASQPPVQALPGDRPRLVGRASIPVRSPRIIHSLCRLLC